MNIMRHRKWLDQKLINEKMERGAVAMSVKYGESIELSDGVSIIVKPRKGFDVVSVIVVAPKDVRVSRPIQE